MSKDTVELLASIVILWAAAAVAYVSIWRQQEAALAELEAEEAEDPPGHGSTKPAGDGSPTGLYEGGWWS